MGDRLIFIMGVKLIFIMGGRLIFINIYDRGTLVLEMLLCPMIESVFMCVN